MAVSSSMMATNRSKLLYTLYLEDNFGADDDDWAIYRKLVGRFSSSILKALY